MCRWIAIVNVIGAFIILNYLALRLKAVADWRRRRARVGGAAAGAIAGWHPMAARRHCHTPWRRRRWRRLPRQWQRGAASEVDTSIGLFPLPTSFSVSLSLSTHSALLSQILSDLYCFPEKCSHQHLLCLIFLIRNRWTPNSSKITVFRPPSVCFLRISLVWINWNRQSIWSLYSIKLKSRNLILILALLVWMNEL